MGKRTHRPQVIWITGLSGAGKTTIAKALLDELRSKGIRAQHLDGDTIRDLLPGTGFSKEQRDEHIKRVGLLAAILEKNGITVIASFISPYREARDYVRRMCKNFVEIYVSTPLEICEKRDPKGLYKKARKGEIDNFTGVSDPYEAPIQPEIIIDTSAIDLKKSIQSVLTVTKI